MGESMSKHESLDVRVAVEEDNPALVAANPDAELKMLSFPAEPSFAKSCTFKVYAPGYKYLYKISSDNKLTLLDQKNSDSDYFGLAVRKLESYVASDIKLNNAQTSSGSTSYSVQEYSSPSAARGRAIS